MTLNLKYVSERLWELYPTSRQITDSILREITDGFDRLGFGLHHFDDALHRFRAEDSKADFPPNMRKLNKYLPQSKATDGVRADNEKHVTIWPASHAHSPRHDQAMRLWQSGKYAEFANVLLQEPGLTEIERSNAEGIRDWASWFTGPDNPMRRKKSVYTKTGRRDNDTEDLIDRVMGNMKIIEE